MALPFPDIMLPNPSPFVCPRRGEVLFDLDLAQRNDSAGLTGSENKS
jgi:hypothetical protein